jgi:hypothetical protein
MAHNKDAGEEMLLCYENLFVDILVNMKEQVPPSMFIKTNLPSGLTVEGLDEYQGHNLDGTYKLGSSFFFHINSGIITERKVNNQIHTKISIYKHERISHPPYIFRVYLTIEDDDQFSFYPITRGYICGLQVDGNFWQSPQFIEK